MRTMAFMLLTIAFGTASACTMQYWAAVPFTWPAFLGWGLAFGSGVFFTAFARET